MKVKEIWSRQLCHEYSLSRLTRSSSNEVKRTRSILLLSAGASSILYVGLLVVLARSAINQRQISLVVQLIWLGRVQFGATRGSVFEQEARCNGEEQTAKYVRSKG